MKVVPARWLIFFYSVGGQNLAVVKSDPPAAAAEPEHVVRKESHSLHDTSVLAPNSATHIGAYNSNR